MRKNNGNKFTILTLGCFKNAVDSETIITNLRANNFEFSTDIKKSDMVIINTCGFINPAKEESLGVIAEAIELKRKGKIKKIMVVGCLSERYRNELIEQLPEVDHIFGINPSADILRTLDKDLKYNLIGEERFLTPCHYAYIKISDGCDNPCSFCAIPLIRGKYVSRPKEEIVKEISLLAKKGVKEFILIAQDSTYYGLDLYGKREIASLLDAISKIDGVKWIRLMYAYPTKFPVEVLDVIHQNEKICKYIDIPLQHISDSVLKSMRRGSSGRYIKNLIETIRAKVPEITIRSTFIVGYPNETEKDFNELLDFINEYQLDRVGVFTYSREDNTLAFELGDPIPEEIKIERRDIIMQAQMSISLKKNKEKIGKKLTVIIDEFNNNSYLARSESDAPEIDNSILIQTGKKLKIGDFAEVLITDALEYDLLATL